MTRALSVPLKNELQANPTRPVFLYEGQFAAGFLRLWTGLGDLSFDGNTYFGNGWLENVSGGAEMDDGSAQELTVSLAGIPQEVVSTLLNAQQGLSGKVWIGAIDSTGALVTSPFLLFIGKLDVPTLDDSASAPKATISYESRLVDMDRSREFRFTSESQKIFYPSDKGFEFVRKAAKWDGFWGQTQRQVDKRRAAREKRQKKSNRR